MPNNRIEWTPIAANNVDTAPLYRLGYDILKDSGENMVKGAKTLADAYQSYKDRQFLNDWAAAQDPNNLFSFREFARRAGSSDKYIGMSNQTLENSLNNFANIYGQLRTEQKDIQTDKIKDIQTQLYAAYNNGDIASVRRLNSELAALNNSLGNRPDVPEYKQVNDLRINEADINAKNAAANASNAAARKSDAEAGSFRLKQQAESDLALMKNLYYHGINTEGGKAGSLANSQMGSAVPLSVDAWLMENEGRHLSPDAEAQFNAWMQQGAPGSPELFTTNSWNPGVVDPNSLVNDSALRRYSPQYVQVGGSYSRRTSSSTPVGTGSSTTDAAAAAADAAMNGAVSTTSTDMPAATSTPNKTVANGGQGETTGSNNSGIARTLTATSNQESEDENGVNASSAQTAADSIINGAQAAAAVGQDAVDKANSNLQAAAPTPEQSTMQSDTAKLAQAQREHWNQEQQQEQSADATTADTATNALASSVTPTTTPTTPASTLSASNTTGINANTNPDALQQAAAAEQVLQQEAQRRTEDFVPEGINEDGTINTETARGKDLQSLIQSNFTPEMSDLDRVSRLEMLIGHGDIKQSELPAVAAVVGVDPGLITPAAEEIDYNKASPTVKLKQVPGASNLDKYISADRSKNTHAAVNAIAETFSAANGSNGDQLNDRAITATQDTINQLGVQYQRELGQLIMGENAGANGFDTLNLALQSKYSSSDLMSQDDLIRMASSKGLTNADGSAISTEQWNSALSMTPHAMVKYLLDNTTLGDLLGDSNKADFTMAAARAANKIPGKYKNLVGVFCALGAVQERGAMGAYFLPGEMKSLPDLADRYASRIQEALDPQTPLGATTTHMLQTIKDIDNTKKAWTEWDSWNQSLIKAGITLSNPLTGAKSAGNRALAETAVLGENSSRNALLDQYEKLGNYLFRSLPYSIQEQVKQDYPNKPKKN